MLCLSYLRPRTISQFLVTMMFMLAAYVLVHIAASDREQAEQEHALERHLTGCDTGANCGCPEKHTKLFLLDIPVACVPLEVSDIIFLVFVPFLTCCATPLVTPTPAPTMAVFEAVIVITPSADLAVVYCTASTVTVRGDQVDAIEVGNIFIYDTGSSRCSACSPLYRAVESIADGATAGTKVLGTRLAKFREVFDITKFPTRVLEAEIEPAFNCPHSSWVSSANDGYKEEDNSVTETNPGFTIATSPAQVGSCPSGWLTKNSDGRCTYTDCFVGEDGSPEDCFYCGTMCDNGCGKTDSILAFPGDFKAFDFGPACCNHDHCYSSSTFNKGSCDLQFRAEMVSACPNLPFWIKYLGPIGAAAKGIIDNVCLIIATGFYGAVALFGEDAYNDRQAAQSNHEMQDVCVA